MAQGAVTLNSARLRAVLTTICVVATATIVAVPLVMYERPRQPRLGPPMSRALSPPKSKQQQFEEEYFGLSRDRMLLYTAPGVDRTPLKRTR